MLSAVSILASMSIVVSDGMIWRFLILRVKILAVLSIQSVQNPAPQSESHHYVLTVLPTFCAFTISWLPTNGASLSLWQAELP
jgi:hypothetical protein